MDNEYVPNRENIYSRQFSSGKMVVASSDIANSVIDINNDAPLPLTLRFNSQTSPINSVINHIGTPGRVRKSSSVDEPDVLMHVVTKPVLQRLKEVIRPYREIIRSVQPVRENIQTVMAKNAAEDSGNLHDQRAHDEDREPDDRMIYNEKQIHNDGQIHKNTQSRITVRKNSPRREPY